MSNQSKVEVLLATYNGERFLREQLDSILAQDYVNFSLLARDDGSTDGTGKILSEYERRFPDRVRVLPVGPSTGSAKANFLILLKESAAKYICFSDQDDVWLPDKISRTKQAMDQLESKWGQDIPLLVFTDLRVVDDKLRTIHESYWAHEQFDPGRIHRLAALLRQSVVTGCTAMLNRRLIEIAMRMPEDAFMHDQWIALLASSMGRSCAVTSQTVLYRQHDRNVIGVSSQAKSLPKTFHRFRHRDGRLRHWYIDQRQAKSLLRVHGAELSAKNRALLEAYLRCGMSRSRFIRVFTLIRYRFFRAGLLRNLATIIDLWTMKVDQHEAG